MVCGDTLEYMLEEDGLPYEGKKTVGPSCNFLANPLEAKIVHHF